MDNSDPSKHRLNTVSWRRGDNGLRLRPVEWQRCRVYKTIYKGNVGRSQKEQEKDMRYISGEVSVNFKWYSFSLER